MAFIEHSPSGTWRGSPFVRGHHYRVLKNAPSYEGQLTTGEVLVYFGAYVGIYYGVSVYAFTNELGEERTWVLGDDEPLESWLNFFAPVPNAG
jgi:hypothetical protein